MTPALLQVLRALPGPRSALMAALARVSFEDVVREAAHHGLAGYLQHVLQANALTESLPAGPLAELKTQAMSLGVKSFKVGRLLEAVLNALAAVEVIPVLLKGYGFASRFYPDANVRPMGDVDVLVPRDRLDACSKALEGLGLASVDEHLDEWALDHHHHLLMHGERGTVELHFHALTGFGTTLDGETLYARAQVDSLFGRAVKYLQLEDELAYLATHAVQHLMMRLSWLMDLKLLLHAHPEIDWEEVIRVCDAAGVATPVYTALWALREGLGGPVPEPVLEALRPSYPQALAIRRLFTPERLVYSVASTTKWRSYATLPLLATGPARMTRFVLANVEHAGKRKLAFTFPRVFPARWRG